MGDDHRKNGRELEKGIGSVTEREREREEGSKGMMKERARECESKRGLKCMNTRARNRGMENV